MMVPLEVLRAEWELLKGGAGMNGNEQWARTLVLVDCLGEKLAALQEVAGVLVRSMESPTVADGDYGYCSECSWCNGKGEDEHPETIVHLPAMRNGIAGAPCLIGELQRVLRETQ